MNETNDNLQTLMAVARQLVETEQAIGGSLLPRRLNALPEAAPSGHVEAPGPAARQTGGPSARPQSAAAPPARPAAAGAFSPESREPMTPIPTARKAEVLAASAQEVAGCTKCVLHKSRTQTVYGDGDPNARLMFIGEGPGADEDAQGLPFVGRAGQKLNEMITAMGLQRSQAYIANAVKCRPPGNRQPAPEEIFACWPYLRHQIEVIQPEVIVLLGNVAVKCLLDTKIGITKLRGQWHELWGIPVMPTFHPAYLLRQYTVENRRRVWSDMQAVMKKLGLKTP